MARKSKSKPAATAAGPMAGAAARLRVMQAYKKTLAHQFSGAVVLVVVCPVVLLTFYDNKAEIPLLPLVIVAGILGAFFSALIRLYNVDAAGALLVSSTAQELKGRHLFMYSFVPPVVGAIAAVVLYMIFVARLIQGTLFPEFGCAAGKSCASVQEMMHNFQPKTAEDYAKAMIWGFIAGFSERLVPDVLQTLVNKQKAAGTRKPKG